MKTVNSERQQTSQFAGWSEIFNYGILQSLLAFSFYVAGCLALKTAFAADYGLLIISGTLSVYSAHKWIKTYLNEGRRNIPDFIYLSFLSALSILIIAYFRSGREYLLHLAIPALIVILYLLPFSRMIRSDLIPGWIKPASLAIAWTWICTGPIIALDTLTSFYIISVFFLILSNALIFDVKDIETDKRSNTSTFAIKYGWKITQKAAFGSLIISTIAIGLFYEALGFRSLIAPLILGLYFIPLKKIKTDSPKNHYYWYLDGALFLFPIAICLMHIFTNMH